ncbi:CAP domain-containing protein [Brevibacillus choshinensis]|uniref:CAP domain-containing protein n=1 Tax=Brevibacillus choshinensis TaxID=54911 RepID=UPI002E23D8EB|nr:CAP domain-containing protein [Brevibacillus choshinensis]
MKRLGTIAIATLGLGFVLSGFSNTASAAALQQPTQSFPYTVQYGYQPVMQQPVQPQYATPIQQPVQQVAAPQPTKQTNQQVNASAVMKQVANLVNQERAKAGLKPVDLDASLNKVAQAKAADMSNNNYFDHTSPTYGSPFDMMKQFGVSYMTAGENIAMGQRTAGEVMNQWMNSEGHRQNIMNPSFTKIGVGYVNGYWVQEFIG